MTKEYIIENFTANISVDEYISRFRDEKRFVEFCKQCPNYGNSWGCPPFDFDTGEFLRQYEYALPFAYSRLHHVVWPLHKQFQFAARFPVYQSKSVKSVRLHGLRLLLIRLVPMSIFRAFCVNDICPFVHFRIFPYHTIHARLRCCRRQQIPTQYRMSGLIHLRHFHIHTESEHSRLPQNHL